MTGKKTGGRTKGKKNHRTEQWETFSTYCLNGGLAKFEKELNKLTGKDYVIAFSNLLEFHKPRLSRTTMVGDASNPILLNFLPVGRKDK